MKCGQQLKVKAFYTYFDIDSGEKEAHWLWYCPEKKWWNGHTKFRTDENGSSYSYES